MIRLWDISVLKLVALVMQYHAQYDLDGPYRAQRAAAPLSYHAAASRRRNEQRYRWRIMIPGTRELRMMQRICHWPAPLSEVPKSLNTFASIIGFISRGFVILAAKCKSCMWSWIIWIGFTQRCSQIKSSAISARASSDLTAC